jgi:peptidoglycan/LPS O-acetylase OafA/YrhL
MKGRYEALDGLRGVAAFAIIWLHVRQILGFASWPPNAALSVDFFFCLSGFVIAHAYEGRLKTTMSFWAFAGQRLLRLMPLAMAGALMGGAVLLVHAAQSHDTPAVNVAAATGLNLFMLPSFGLIPDNPQVFATDGPLWSLFWELLINAAFALAALRLTTPRLVALVLAGAGLTLWTAISQADHLDVGSRNSTFILGFCRVLFPFSCGALIRRLPARRSGLGAVLAPFLAAVLAALLLGPALGGLGQALAVLAAFPLIVWLGAGVEVGPRIGSRIPLPLARPSELPAVRGASSISAGAGDRRAAAGPERTDAGARPVPGGRDRRRLARHDRRRGGARPADARGPSRTAGPDCDVAGAPEGSALVFPQGRFVMRLTRRLTLSGGPRKFS